MHHSDLNTTKDMVDFIKSTYKFEQTPVQKFRKLWYIGYQHCLYKNKENIQTITKVQALEYFYEDLQKIENSHYVKKLKNSITQDIYDILVHLYFDYGISFIRNSKIYYYIEKQDKENILKELENLKSLNRVLDDNNNRKRNFDIHLLKTGTYKASNGNRKRKSKKNVGFRY